MELKVYARILRRRWPIVLALPLLVALFGVAREATRDPVYVSSGAANVIREPDDALPDRYNGYYNYVSSEFAIDDLLEAVRGNVFAEAVTNRMTAAGTEISAGEVVSALAAEREHRVLMFTASSATPERARMIAEAAVAELDERAFDFLGVSESESFADVSIIQRPGEGVSDPTRERLLVALMLVAALGLGALLALLVDYLDDRLYDADAASAAVDLPHLASVPVGSRG